MSPEARIYAGSTVYGLFVCLGAALLGFVVAPIFGVASGLFPIDAEARGFFSLLTLKAAPYLFALGILSALLYPTLSGRRILSQLTLFGVNVLVAWLLGAAIALAILR